MQNTSNCSAVRCTCSTLKVHTQCTQGICVLKNPSLLRDRQWQIRAWANLGICQGNCCIWIFIIIAIQKIVLLSTLWVISHHKRILKRNLADVGIAQCMNALADKVHKQEKPCTQWYTLHNMVILFNNHPYISSNGMPVLFFFDENILTINLLCMLPMHLQLMHHPCMCAPMNGFQQPLRSALSSPCKKSASVKSHLHSNQSLIGPPPEHSWLLLAVSNVTQYSTLRQFSKFSPLLSYLVLCNWHEIDDEGVDFHTAVT